ncbi:WxL domain-containing protein [Enterococcus casseliflavus]|nr:WxL domain-containing protein [Enterococcus casseliflavus]
MKRTSLPGWLKCLSASLFLACVVPISVNASTSSLKQTGAVSVEQGVSQPIDPERPENPGDPGEGPSTKGTLRFDFASSLDFGEVVISPTNRQYSALAQQFLDPGIGPRGSFVQVSDHRISSTGWTLQVKQDHPFTQKSTNNDVRSLDGAILSLDKGWVNSTSESNSPQVFRERIDLVTNGMAHTIAKSEAGAGRGVWTIAFGGNEKTPVTVGNTLTPVTDSRGKPLLDDETKKPVYRNDAITLSVPDQTEIKPGTYHTTVTWILAALP